MDGDGVLREDRLQAAPEPGDAVVVAPGIVWLRLPLPFRLDHVNCYLVRDGDGWLVIDTGPGHASTYEAWTALLDGGSSGPLEGRPITRILVTHHHPDHVGAARFLAERTGARLLMAETEYLSALGLLAGDTAALIALRAAFYKCNGLDPARIESLSHHADRYRALVPGLPDTVGTLRDGDALDVGDRTFTILEMPGHAPAQIGLWSAADNILFVADQVLTRISPNVGVAERAPDDDPLGRFLQSLARLRGCVPEGGLVLPGHHLPFTHLHSRMRELVLHHDVRCDAIASFCSTGKGLTAAELVTLVFPFPLDDHQFWFAFSEILAHLNHLGRLGRLERRDAHGRRRWGTPGRLSHPP